MKPDNASEDMWLSAYTTNEKLNRDAQTQDAAGMQAMSILYITHL